jgi:hypothetical protein
MLSPTSSQREKYAHWPFSILTENDALSPHHSRICAVYVSSALADTPSKGNGGSGRLSSPQCHSAGDLVVRSSTTQRGSHTLHHDAVA